MQPNQDVSADRQPIYKLNPNRPAMTRRQDMNVSPKMKTIMRGGRSFIDGVSPRMVTFILNRPDFRAGYAHGETLEIRECGRGPSCVMPGPSCATTFIC